MNWIIKKIVFVSLSMIWFVSSSAFANTAKELFYTDLSKQVFTTNKPIRLYSYFNLPTVTDSNGATALDPYFHNLEQRASWTKNFVLQRGFDFWNLNNHSTAYINAGAGLYLAIDPHSSTEFGNSMVSFLVSAESNYLNVFKPISLRKETINALIAEKLIDRKQLLLGESSLQLSSGFSRFALKNMLRIENNLFRQLVMDFFKENNIQLIQYEYKSHLAGFCKKSDQSAFVFVGKPADKIENLLPSEIVSDLYLLSSMSIESFSESENLFKNTIDRLKNLLGQFRQNGAKQFEKLIPETFTGAEYTNLVEQSFNCTKKINYN